jgi:hypothetical protein
VRLDDGRVDAFYWALRTRKDEPVAAAHDPGNIIPPAEVAKCASHSELGRELPNGSIQRTGTCEDASNSWIELVELREHFKRKQWILFRHHSPGKEQDPGVVGKSKLAAKCDTVSIGHGQAYRAKHRTEQQSLEPIWRWQSYEAVLPAVVCLEIFMITMGERLRRGSSVIWDRR